MIDPVSATGVVIAALTLAHQVLKSAGVSRADKKAIVKKAESLIEIAQLSDIDKEASKAKSRALGSRYSSRTAPVKTSAAKRVVAHRKAVPKKTTASKYRTQELRPKQRSR